MGLFLGTKRNHQSREEGWGWGGVGAKAELLAPCYYTFQRFILNFDGQQHSLHYRFKSELLILDLSCLPSLLPQKVVSPSSDTMGISVVGLIFQNSLSEFRVTFFLEMKWCQF